MSTEAWARLSGFRALEQGYAVAFDFTLALLELLVEDADEKFSAKAIATIDHNTGEPGQEGWADVFAHSSSHGNELISHFEPPPELPSSSRVLFTSGMLLADQPTYIPYGILPCPALAAAPDRVLRLLPETPPTTSATGMQLLGIYRAEDPIDSTITEMEYGLPSGSRQSSESADVVRVISTLHR